jgi:hypothetical protein
MKTRAPALLRTGIRVWVAQRFLALFSLVGVIHGSLTAKKPSVEQDRSEKLSAFWQRRQEVRRETVPDFPRSVKASV